MSGYPTPVRSRESGNSERRVGLDRAGDLGLELGEHGFERCDHLREGLPDRAGLRGAGAAAFGVQGIDELAAANHHLAQRLVAFDERREAAAREFESGEVGEQAGIEPVGLGLDATPGAERRGFIGVHAGERHACLAQALA